MKLLPPISIGVSRLLPGKWDLVATLLVLGLILAFADASRSLGEPLARLNASPLSLAPSALPGYALRTGLRMLIALWISLAFTFTYATWAAKSARAGSLLIALLDILQSVPILGFISVASLFLLSLAPGRVFGAELIAVFAIFTSQAWNMAFSFYQSLRTVPQELTEAGRLFGLNGWARFWRIEVPFAMPALVWNMMMSMSGGWFFVVAAEAISVGHTNVALPGIGSYIAEAIAQRDLSAIAWAIGAMAIVILIYDQLLFRPLVSWADAFRIDNEQGEDLPDAWVLTALRRSRLMDRVAAPFAAAWRWSYRLSLPRAFTRDGPAAERRRRAGDIVWAALVASLTGLAIWRASGFVAQTLTLADAGHAIVLGLLTALRVFVLIALASLIWLPIGIYVGLRPRLTRIVQPLAQFLAAFPANLLFPVAVFAIVTYRLDPDIWLSPLMILGTQWYILFNVIAGASALPRELRQASDNLQIKGWLWWRKVALPCVFPYYVTGAIAASGGSWNASVVAELVVLGPSNADRTRSGRLYHGGHGPGRFPSHRAGHRRDERLRRHHQSRVLAPALRLRRTQVPPDLRTCHGRPVAARSERPCARLSARPGGAELLVLDGVDLSVTEGEIVGLLGRSGSGKSTLLRLIAGLSRPSGGTVRYLGAPVDGPARGIAMVFQSFALFPWLTVLENVQLGLEALGLPAKEIRSRALAAIDLIGLDGYESAYPRELSGGMRQRVGFARALVVHPNILSDGRALLGAGRADGGKSAHRFSRSVGRGTIAHQGRHSGHAQYRGGGADVRPHSDILDQSWPRRHRHQGGAAASARPQRSQFQRARRTHLCRDDGPARARAAPRALRRFGHWHDPAARLLQPSVGPRRGRGRRAL